MVTENATRRRQEEARLSDLTSKLKKAKVALDKSRKQRSEKDKNGTEKEDHTADDKKKSDLEESDDEYKLDFEIKEELEIEEIPKSSSSITSISFLPDKTAWLIGQLYITLINTCF